jgi:hypothetical protein
MSSGARALVSIVFLILGLSFVAETVMMLHEFGGTNWLTIATHDSHLFLFFPTLGIVALAAFYWPACAFTDMYLRHVRYGPTRFVLGFLIVAGMAHLIATGLTQSRFRSVWDIAPATLAADLSEPPGCGTSGKPCERIALLEALENIRIVSETRLGLREFVRKCAKEPLIELPLQPEAKRFCFASTPLTESPRLSTDAECCRAQNALQNHIIDLYKDPSQRSATSTIHAALLPLKVFFLLVLGVISILLAIRHRSIAHYYPEHIGRIDVGVVVGAIAMIFFPLMSQAFVETADALYGTSQNEGFKPIVPFMSFAFGAWALLLLMFFYRRHDREVELAGKFAGVIASAVAIVKYDLLVSLMVRFLGSGAGYFSIGFLAALAVIALIVLLRPRRPAAMALDRQAK